MKNLFNMFTRKAVANVAESKSFAPVSDEETEEITACQKNPSWSWHNFNDKIGGGFLVADNGGIVLEYDVTPNGVLYFCYGRKRSKTWKRYNSTFEKFKLFAERKFVAA